MKNDIVAGVILGAVFGTAVVGTGYHGLISARDREISFLRTEYFIAQGLAQVAVRTAEHSADIAETYAREAVTLRRERTIARLATYINRMNPKAPSMRIASAIVASAETNGLDIRWWAAQVEEESHFNPRAVSRVGARGLAQIMPATAKELDLPWEHAFDIEANLEAGARYMAIHRRNMGYSLALVRYSGGEPDYEVRIRKRLRRMGNF